MSIDDTYIFNFFNLVRLERPASSLVFGCVSNPSNAADDDVFAIFATYTIKSDLEVFQEREGGCKIKRGLR